MPPNLFNIFFVLIILGRRNLNALTVTKSKGEEKVVDEEEKEFVESEGDKGDCEANMIFEEDEDDDGQSEE